MNEEPRYPHIIVTLTNNDGNAFGILGAVRRALRKGGVPETEVSAFYKEATEGDYDHLLVTVMKYVSIE